MLAGRLTRLVDEGLLARERYQERPDRYEYTLTQKGLDLWPAINALRAWGDRYATPDGMPREFVHEQCGSTIEAAAFCPHCQTVVGPEDVLSGPGPGYRGPIPAVAGRYPKTPLLTPVGRATLLALVERPAALELDDPVDEIEPLGAVRDQQDRLIAGGC